MMTQLIILCLFAFLAGFIDSIVGGGGLIQLPALMIVLPNTAIPLLFGTNKLSSIAGTSAAAIGFFRKVKINRWVAIPSTITALICSFLGAKTVSIIHPAVLRPLILILLIIVAFYTLTKKDFGSEYIQKVKGIKQGIYAAIIGAVLGFYDGFLGPGTGSFLIFGFIGILGFDFLRASAAAKVVNFSTNLSAIIYFASTDNILYHYAIPMAVCNMIGANIGVRLAILKGSAFIRRLFILVVGVLIIKLGYDIFVSYFLIS